MKHIELIEKLRRLRVEGHKCDRVYCTTCGGYAYAARRNMTTVLKNDIGDALSNMTASDFKAIGEWGEFFREVDRTAVIAILTEKRKRYRQLTYANWIGTYLTLES